MEEKHGAQREPNLVNRDGVWQMDFYEARRGRIRISTRTRDLETARAILAGTRGTVCEVAERPAAEKWREFLVAEEGELLAYLAKSRERAIRRDRRRGREPNLSPDDMRALFGRSGGRCEVTGIPFSLAKCAGTFRRPFAPSIDRINNGEPYSFVNCRLIALAVNIGINEWGESVFRRIAKGVIARELVA